MNGDKILARYVAVMPHSLRTMTIATSDLEAIYEYVQGLRRAERRRACEIVDKYTPYMRIQQEIMGDLDEPTDPRQLEFDFDGSGIS
jgi:hypothetical protein